MVQFMEIQFCFYNQFFRSDYFRLNLNHPYSYYLITFHNVHILSKSVRVLSFFALSLSLSDDLGLCWCLTLVETLGKVKSRPWPRLDQMTKSKCHRPQALSLLYTLSYVKTNINLKIIGNYMHFKSSN